MVISYYQIGFPSCAGFVLSFGLMDNVWLLAELSVKHTTEGYGEWLLVTCRGLTCVLVVYYWLLWLLYTINGKSIFVQTGWRELTERF